MKLIKKVAIIAVATFALSSTVAFADTPICSGLNGSQAKPAVLPDSNAPVSSQPVGHVPNSTTQHQPQPQQNQNLQ